MRTIAGSAKVNRISSTPMPIITGVWLKKSIMTMFLEIGTRARMH